jgi:serine phosphatase RsbU (regulator of sigma subunit)/pSer/pThr/pTyr-binding forkhead associated (FHA) protein
MLKLRVTTPGNAPRAIEVTQRRLSIGRSIRNDLCLEDGFASRMHAELRVDGESFWLTDIGSANGTFVNERPVTGTIQVYPGDQIVVGKTVIELQTTASGLQVRPDDTTDEVSARDFVTSPEMTREPSRNHEISSGLFTVLESVQKATGPDAALESVDHRGDLFAVMSKVGIALLSPSSLDEVLEQIVDLVFEGVNADRAFLLLKQPGSGELTCKVASYRDARDQSREIRISRSITSEVIGNGQALLTSNAQEDERFKDRASIVLEGVRSVLAVPISDHQQVIGMIYVDSPIRVNVFTDDDLRMLTTIATIAGIKIENALLVEQRIENERIRQQLTGARDIQGRLLPVTAPRVPGYDMVGVSFPCYEVGGDYFDFIPLGRQRIMLALGDVAGKGMDAAILMSSLHATVRAQAGATSSLAELMDHVNSYLYAATPYNRFATMFCGDLNAEQHVLTYSNAGHNPPLLIRKDGSLTSLEAGGPPVGITAGRDFPEDSVEIRPGDVLVVFSDGISEAINSEEQPFRLDELVQTVRDNPTADAAKLRDRIDETILSFMGDTPPQDDMTLMIVKRNG